jgi:predicted ATPase with chaperone activity
MSDPNYPQHAMPENGTRDDGRFQEFPEPGTVPLSGPPPQVRFFVPSGPVAPPAPGTHMTAGPVPASTSGRPAGPPSYPPAAMGPRATMAPIPGQNSGPNLMGLPPRPTTLQETELDPTSLEELALKTVASVATITGGDLAGRLRLPLPGVAEHIIATLRRDNLIEPVGGGAAMIGAAGMNLRATERGVERARHISERSGYIGPAPVPLSAFEFVLRQQSPARRTISRDLIWRRLAHLVLPDDVVDRIGAGVDAGGPLFLYGNPGNGKTAIGAAIARAVGGGALVPHAVEVDGQIVRVFDPAIHRPVPVEKLPPARLDERWVVCHPPFVQVGGELRLEQLDLHWNDRQRFYDAPIQVKAAGGVLLIDDFGRQQHSPAELLNRWIIPMETGMDFLSLITGHQVAIPFTPLLVFATNLDPLELADEAFLRRLPCKVQVPDPTPETFHEIFRRTCVELGIEYNEQGYAYLIERYYTHARRDLRSSHPRDLARLLVSGARYFGVAPQLTPQLVDVAAGLYFV